MKKRLFIPVLVVFTVIVLAVLGCTKPARSAEKLSIVVSIHPYELLVRQLVGEQWEVSTIIPVNASPHTYSPTPEDIKKIEDADLVFSNGLGLESYLLRVIEKLGERSLTAEVILEDYIDLESLDTSDDKHHHNGNHHHNESHHQNEADHHHGTNPHLWLDPVFLEVIATGIVEKLSGLDEQNRDYYRDNLAILTTELKDLDNEIRTAMQGKSLNIINFHDAFHYFNKRYGVNTAAIVAESPGREPTPRELTRLGQIIKEKNVKVIFIEPQLNPKAGEVIAKEFNLKLDTLDPLGVDGEISTITDLLQANWRILQNYLN